MVGQKSHPFMHRVRSPILQPSDEADASTRPATQNGRRMLVPKSSARTLVLVDSNKQRVQQMRRLAEPAVTPPSPTIPNEAFFQVTPPPLPPLPPLPQVPEMAIQPMSAPLPAISKMITTPLADTWNEHESSRQNLLDSIGDATPVYQISPGAHKIVHSAGHSTVPPANDTDYKRATLKLQRLSLMYSPGPLYPVIGIFPGALSPVADNYEFAFIERLERRWSDIRTEAVKVLRSAIYKYYFSHGAWSDFSQIFPDRIVSLWQAFLDKLPPEEHVYLNIPLVSQNPFLAENSDEKYTPVLTRPIPLVQVLQTLASDDDHIEPGQEPGSPLSSGPNVNMEFVDWIAMRFNMLKMESQEAGTQANAAVCTDRELDLTNSIAEIAKFSEPATIKELGLPPSPEASGTYSEADSPREDKHKEPEQSMPAIPMPRSPEEEVPRQSEDWPASEDEELQSKSSFSISQTSISLSRPTSAHTSSGRPSYETTFSSANSYESDTGLPDLNLPDLNLPPLESNVPSLLRTSYRRSKRRTMSIGFGKPDTLEQLVSTPSIRRAPPNMPKRPTTREMMLKDLPPLPPLGQLDDLNFPADPAPQAPSVYAGSMRSRFDPVLASDSVSRPSTASSHIMSQSELSPSSSSASLRDAAVRKPSSSRSIRMRAKHLGISADARPSTVSNDSTETTYMKRPAVGALGEYDPVPPLRLTGKQSARKAPPYEWRSAAEAARSEFTAVPTKPVQPSTLRRESDLSFMTNASTDSISWQPHSIKPLLPLKQPTDHPDHVVQQDGVHESAVRRKLLPSLQPQTRLLTQPQRLAQPQVVPVQTQLTPLKHSRSMAYAKPKTQFPRLADNSSRQSLQSSTSHYVPALMPLASSKESDAIYCQSQITLVSQSSKSSKHSVVPPLLPLATSKEKSEEEQRQKQPQKKALPPLSPLKSTAAKFEPFNQIQQPTGMKTVPVIRRARKISVSSGRSTCVESVLTEVARKSTEAGSDFEQCEPLVSRMRAAGLEITRVAEQDFYDYCVDELLKASTEAFHDVSSMISETLAEEIFFSFNNHLNELLASSR